MMPKETEPTGGAAFARRLRDAGVFNEPERHTLARIVEVVEDTVIRERLPRNPDLSWEQAHESAKDLTGKLCDDACKSLEYRDTPRSSDDWEQFIANWRPERQETIGTADPDREHRREMMDNSALLRLLVVLHALKSSRSLMPHSATTARNGSSNGHRHLEIR